jgi:hypothetical protein
MPCSRSTGGLQRNFKVVAPCSRPPIEHLASVAEATGLRRNARACLPHAHRPRRHLCQPDALLSHWSAGAQPRWLEAIARKRSGSFLPICSSSAWNGWLFHQKKREIETLPFVGFDSTLPSGAV